MSIIKGIISNGLANVVQKLVRIADQLLLVPFFLTHWGAAMYGEWLTLTIIPSVLAFSDLGFGSAVSNSFVLAYAKVRLLDYLFLCLTRLCFDSYRYDRL